MPFERKQKSEKFRKKRKQEPTVTEKGKGKRPESRPVMELFETKDPVPKTQKVTAPKGVDPEVIEPRGAEPRGTELEGVEPKRAEPERKEMREEERDMTERTPQVLEDADFKQAVGSFTRSLRGLTQELQRFTHRLKRTRKQMEEASSLGKGG